MAICCILVRISITFFCCCRGKNASIDDINTLLHLLLHHKIRQTAPGPGTSNQLLLDILESNMGLLHHLLVTQLVQPLVPKLAAPTVDDADGFVNDLVLERRSSFLALLALDESAVLFAFQELWRTESCGIVIHKLQITIAILSINIIIIVIHQHIPKIAQNVLIQQRLPSSIPWIQKVGRPPRRHHILWCKSTFRPHLWFANLPHSIPRLLDCRGVGHLASRLLAKGASRGINAVDDGCANGAAGFGVGWIGGEPIVVVVFAELVEVEVAGVGCGLGCGALGVDDVVEIGAGGFWTATPSATANAAGCG
mmetsp:Transcript_19467/g.31799  ORF Transcript_19467/g.31799 Transcript_19467/m.31799 type:complete len:310 (-) Transcript_19467:2-931(-)